MRDDEARPSCAGETRFELYDTEVLIEMKEGKLDYISLSTVGAETIGRAHKVRSSFLSISI